MRLNGGEFLLNLLVLGALTISPESVTITDESVIKQLTGLKNYINNEKAIKPLFVKYDNGTEIVVAKGEVRKTKDALSFELVCVTKSNSLTINVAFTQKVNANDDLIDDYEIESGDATLTFTNEVQIFENIVDKDGHKRFDEWDIETEEITGVTFTFAKASLSGTHLMFVIAGEIANNTSLENNRLWGRMVISEWIYNKIIDLGDGVIEVKGFGAYNGSVKVLDNTVYYKKESNNRISFYRVGLTTATTNVSKIRVSFDLLIDNE